MYSSITHLWHQSTVHLTNISGVLVLCKALLNNQSHGSHRSYSQGAWSLAEVPKTFPSSFFLAFSTKVFPVWNVPKGLGHLLSDYGVPCIRKRIMKWCLQLKTCMLMVLQYGRHQKEAQKQAVCTQCAKSLSCYLNTKSFTSHVLMALSCADMVKISAWATRKEPPRREIPEIRTVPGMVPLSAVLY